MTDIVDPFDQGAGQGSTNPQGAGIVDPFDSAAPARNLTKAPSASQATLQPYDGDVSVAPPVAPPAGNPTQSADQPGLLNSAGDLWRGLSGSAQHGYGMAVKGFSDAEKWLNTNVPGSRALDEFTGLTPEVEQDYGQQNIESGAKTIADTSPAFKAATSRGLTDQGGFTPVNIASKAVNTVGEMAAPILASLIPGAGEFLAPIAFAAQGEAGGREEGEQQVKALTDDQIAAIPGYEGMSPADARAKLSDAVSDRQALMQGAFGGALGVVGKIPGVDALGNATAGTLSRVLLKPIANRVGAGIGEAAGFSGINAAGQVIGNVTNPIPTDTFAGVPEAAASGLAPGLVMGVARGLHVPPETNSGNTNADLLKAANPGAPDVQLPAQATAVPDSGASQPQPAAPAPPKQQSAPQLPDSNVQASQRDRLVADWQNATTDSQRRASADALAAHDAMSAQQPPPPNPIDQEIIKQRAAPTGTIGKAVANMQTTDEAGPIPDASLNVQLANSAAPQNGVNAPLQITHDNTIKLGGPIAPAEPFGGAGLDEPFQGADARAASEGVPQPAPESTATAVPPPANSEPAAQPLPFVHAQDLRDMVDQRINALHDALQSRGSGMTQDDLNQYQQLLANYDQPYELAGLMGVSVDPATIGKTKATGQDDVGAANLANPANLAPPTLANFADSQDSQRTPFDLPGAAQQRQYVADMQAHGVPDDVIQQHMPQAPKDSVTGFYDARADNVKTQTVQRAIDHVGDTGDQAQYVSADIANLGGLNHHVGDNAEAANVHYRAMSDILADELGKTGADVVPMRTGGDELGAIVVNSHPDATRQAVARAQTRISEYAQQNGLDAIPNAKRPGEQGVGMHIGVADIKHDSTVKDVLDAADAGVHASKNRNGGNVGRSEIGKAGSDASAKQAAGTGSGGGKDSGGLAPEKRAVGRQAGPGQGQEKPDEGEVALATAPKPKTPPQGGASASVETQRSDRVKASRQAGNVHLDKLDATVEGMRGKRISYVHGDESGIIDSVDNEGRVRVRWETGANAGEYGLLHKGDFKDYAVTGSLDGKALTKLRKQWGMQEEAKARSKQEEMAGQASSEVARIEAETREARPLLDKLLAGTEAEREAAHSYLDGDIGLAELHEQVREKPTIDAIMRNADGTQTVHTSVGPRKFNDTDYDVGLLGSSQKDGTVVLQRGLDYTVPDKPEYSRIKGLDVRPLYAEHEAVERNAEDRGTNYSDSHYDHAIPAEHQMLLDKLGLKAGTPEADEAIDQYNKFSDEQVKQAAAVKNPKVPPNLLELPYEHPHSQKQREMLAEVNQGEPKPAETNLETAPDAHADLRRALQRIASGDAPDRVLAGENRDTINAVAKALGKEYSPKASDAKIIDNLGKLAIAYRMSAARAAHGKLPGGAVDEAARGFAANTNSKLPSTDIRIGDKVLVDGDMHTVTGPLKDGRKSVGVVARRDLDTDPLKGIRSVFLRGDNAIAAKIAAEKALGMSAARVATGKLPRSAIDEAARESVAHPESEATPTPAQHEANNFKQGHVNIHGLDVTVQVPKGGLRKGVDSKGNAWEREASDHYGHIRGTVSRDGEPVDVYLGPHAEDPDAKVFVIDQVKPGTKIYDESKAMLGFKTGREARASYDANFPKGMKVFGGIKEMSIGEFKAWVKSGDAKKPAKAAKIATPPEMYARGKSAQAVKMPDGTWRTRVRQAGKWQPWQERATFDASSAFGYRSFQPDSGEITIPGHGKVTVGAKREAYQAPPKGPATALDALAKVGLNRDAWKAAGVDPKELTHRRGFQYLFRKEGGLTPDQAREALQQDGYLPEDPHDAPPVTEANDAIDIVQRGLADDHTYSIHDQDAVAQMRYEHQQDWEAQVAHDLPDVPDAKFDTAEQVSSIAAKAKEIGIHEMDIAPFVGETDTAYITRMQREIAAHEERQNVADNQPNEADHSQDVQRGTEAFVLQGDETKPEPQRKPDQQTSLFAEPTTKERVAAAQADKDRELSGGDKTVVPMRSGAGELFAGKRPDQATIGEPAKETLTTKDGATAELTLKASAETKSETKPPLSETKPAKAETKAPKAETIEDFIESKTGADGKVALFSKEAEQRSAFSDAERFAKAVTAFDAGKLPMDKPVRVTEGTPEVLRKLGAADLPIEIEPRELAKVMRKEGEAGGKHGLGKQILQQLVRQLHEPVAVFEGDADRPDTRVMLTELRDAGNKPVMVAVQLDRYGQAYRVNSIRSVYGRPKSQFKSWVKDRLLYIDQTKAPAWLTTGELQLLKAVQAGRAGASETLAGQNTGELQLLKASPSEGFERRILTDKDIVKPFTSGRGSYAADGGSNEGPAGRQVGLQLPEAAASQRQGASVPPPGHTEDVRAAVNEAKKDWGDNAPHVRVIDSPEQLPTAAKADPGYTRAKGFYDGKTAYVVASKHTDTDSALRTLAHEVVGHHGIENILNDHVKGGWDQLAGDIDRLRTQGLGSEKMRAVLADVEKRYPGADKTTFAKETLAVMAERDVKNGILDRAIAAVRAFVRKMFPDLKFGEADLGKLLQHSDDYLTDTTSMRTRQEAVGSMAFGKQAGTFYSALHDSLVKAKGIPKKGGEALKQWLDGAQRRGEFKGSERQWLGVDQFLDAHKDATREDLQQFVRDHQVEVTPVKKGEEYEANMSSGHTEIFRSRAEAEARIKEENNWIDDQAVMVYDPDESSVAVVDYDGNELFNAKEEGGEWIGEDANGTPYQFDNADEAHEKAEDLAYNYRENLRENVSDEPRARENRSSVKFNRPDLVLLGGENYREHLLTLPAPSAESVNARLSELTKQYNAKLNDWRVARDTFPRDLARIDGLQKSIEDISDEQRRLETERRTIYGGIFKSGHYDEPNILAHVRMNDRTTADGKSALHIEEIQSDWHQKGRREGYANDETPAKISTLPSDATVTRTGTWYQVVIPSADNSIGRGRTEAEAIRSAIDAANYNLSTRANKLRVPDAPLKNTEGWAMLGFKHALREAVETGKDRLTWTTGETQAERYDLSKQVHTVSWTKAADGKYSIEADHGGGEPIVKKGMTESELADKIGKEAAQKIVDGVGKFADDKSGQNRGRLENADLKVGGEGMRGFYDKILPKAVEKYVKQWGGKVSLEPEGGRETLPDRGSVKKYAGLSLDPVNRGMGAAVENDKVAKAVVGRLPVDVMDLLSANGLRAEDVVREPSMLADKLPIDKRVLVTDGIRNALSEVAARLRAGLDSAEKSGLDKEILPALRASDLDLNVATGIRFPELLRSGERDQSAAGDVGTRGTGAGAESRSGSVALGGREGLPAGLADFQKWHDGISHRKGDVIMPQHWGVDITPAMRAAVESGQPLFSRAATTDTPEFKKFFGDSKVVDSKGEPQTMYHGTAAEFSVFGKDKAGEATGHATAPLGHFFTADRKLAERYAENASEGVPAEQRVVDAYLSIKKPYEMSLKEAQAIDTPADAAALRDKLKAEGFDGVHIKDSKSWIAFDPEQIKSASGNRGTFDTKNPDIHFSKEAPSEKEWKAAAREFTRKSVVKKPVYHGTNADFTEFDTSRGDLGAHFGTKEQAGKSTERQRGQGAGPNVMPVYLDLRNPLRLKDVGSFHADGIAPELARKGWITAKYSKEIVAATDKNFRLREKYDQELRDLIKSKGYDGVVYKNTTEGAGDSYIVFDPRQIKSATGNRGTFDRNNPDITYRRTDRAAGNTHDSVSSARREAGSVLGSGSLDRLEKAGVQFITRADLDSMDLSAGSARFADGSSVSGRPLTESEKDGVRGVTINGTPHIVADNIPKGDVAKTIVHEVVHANIEQVLGGAQGVREIANIIHHLAGLKDKDGNLLHPELRAAVDEIPADTSPAKYHEEIIAHAGEFLHDDSLWHQIKDKVLTNLAKLGIGRKWADTNEALIRGIVRDTMRDYQNPKVRQSAEGRTNAAPIETVKKEAENTVSDKKSSENEDHGGNTAARPVNEATETKPIAPGDRVRVTKGIAAGREGTVVRLEGNATHIRLDNGEEVGLSNKVVEHAETKQEGSEATGEPRSTDTDTTGIKNAKTAEWAEAHGQEHVRAEVHGREAAQAEARDRLARDPAAGQKLAAELSENPRRAVTDTDAALMNLHLGDVRRAHMASVDKVNALAGSNDEQAKIRARLEMEGMDAQLGTAERAGAAVRERWHSLGMALQDEVTPEGLFARWKNYVQARGGGKPLSAEAQGKIKELTDKIATLEKRIASQRGRGTTARDPKERYATILAKLKEIAKRQDTVAAYARDNGVSFAEAMKQFQKDAPKPTAEQIEKNANTESAVEREMKQDDVAFARSRDDEERNLVRQMARALVEGGETDAQALVNRIHEDVGETVKLSRDMVRNIIAGVVKGAAPTKTELTTRMEAIRKELRSEYNANKQDSRRDTTRQKALHKQLGDIERRVKQSDFSKVKREAPKYSEDTFDLQRQVNIAKRGLEKAATAAENANKSLPGRIADGAIKMQRLFILSHLSALQKLPLAAVTKMAMTPLEEGIGSALRRVPGLSRIAEIAPRHGQGFTPAAEAQGVRGIRMAGKGAGQLFRQGYDWLDDEYGSKWKGADEWSNLSGRIHSMMKEPAKLNEFYRSFYLRSQHARNQAIRDGMTPTRADAYVDQPSVKYMIGEAAYADAQEAIMQGKNALVDAIDSAVRGIGHSSAGGKAFERLFNILVPIKKVPGNIVKEATSYAGGGIKALPKLIQAVRKGAESLTPEQADYVMKNLKKQAVGTVLMGIGYTLGPAILGGIENIFDDDYNDYKKRLASGKPLTGTAKVNGVYLNPNFFHAPATSAIQAGAQYRKMIEDEGHKADFEKGLGDMLKIAGSYAINEGPSIGSLYKTYKYAHSGNKTNEIIGHTLQGMVVPGLATDVAKGMDYDRSKDQNRNNPAWRNLVDVPGGQLHARTRYPQSVVQGIQEGIPFARNLVPDRKVTQPGARP